MSDTYKDLLPEDVDVTDGDGMITSVVALIQYIDGEGREVSNMFVVSPEDGPGPGTWQLLGLLELAKTGIINDQYGGPQ